MGRMILIEPRSAKQMGLRPHVILFGGSGDDAIEGGLSADRLYGGAGADTLAGNGGIGGSLFADSTTHGEPVQPLMAALLRTISP